MTVTLTDRGDVNVANLRRVALEGEDVRFSATALEAMARWHAGFQAYCAAHEDEFIYRVTSGAGGQVRRRYSLAETRRQGWQRRRVPSPAFGGQPFAEHVTRAALFAALAAFVEGHGCIPPERAEAIARRLGGPLPAMPSRGLLAAGELMTNAFLFGEPYTSPGDGFATGHGAQTSAAMAALAAISSTRREELARHVFALGSAACEALATPDVADALATVGHVLATLHEVAEVSLRGVGCNPVYLPPGPGYPEGRVLSNGGFHNAQAAPALDAMAVAWVNLAILAHQQIIGLHYGHLPGLPERLATLPAKPARPSSGYSTAPLAWVPSDYVTEMQRLAAPTLLAPAEIADDQDDIAITAPAAFRAEEEAGRLLDHILAVLAVSASQALQVTARQVHPALGPFLERIRSVFPPVTSYRQLGAECAQVAAMFSAAVLHPDGIIVTGRAARGQLQARGLGS
jgi:histidine ammonia-lyase